MKRAILAGLLGLAVGPTAHADLQHIEDIRCKVFSTETVDHYAFQFTPATEGSNAYELEVIVSVYERLDDDFEPSDPVSSEDPDAGPISRRVDLYQAVRGEDGTYRFGQDGFFRWEFLGDLDGGLTVTFSRPESQLPLLFEGCTAPEVGVTVRN